MTDRPLESPRLPWEPEPSEALMSALAGLSRAQLVEYHERVGTLHHDGEMPLIEAERQAFKAARRRA